MTDKEKIFEILKTYVKKNGITASVVILEEYAEELSKNGLVFSKELSAENERLKAVSEAELDTIHNLGEDYEKALEEINRLNERDKKNERIIELDNKLIKTQSAEIERLKNQKCLYAFDGEFKDCIKADCFYRKKEDEVKSEAIKEFARELKCGVPQETGIIRCIDVDLLVKEMVGDDNA